MHSLFSKIFLWFWLATALVGFATYGVTVATQPLELLRPLPRAVGAVRRASPRTRVLRLSALLLTAGFVCYGLARYLAAPATELRKATRRLAAGDLSTRVAPKFGRRRDELADLARDFDTMAERIEVLLSSQKQLLSDISHELRSPLARLQLALSLTERDLEENNPHHGQKNLDRIAHEAARLDALIGQLLSLSRLGSDSANLSIEPLNLLELAREVAADANFEAHAGNKQVILQNDDEKILLDGDRVLLRSAVENVVRNAVRHAPENSIVKILLQKEDDTAVLRVCDEGSGVPEAMLPRLFEPFFRTDEARVHEGGVGLGLAITRRAVEQHGGQVFARNLVPCGLCVELKLPLATPS